MCIAVVCALLIIAFAVAAVYHWCGLLSLFVDCCSCCLLMLGSLFLFVVDCCCLLLLVAVDCGL